VGDTASAPRFCFSGGGCADWKTWRGAPDGAVPLAPLRRWAQMAARLALRASSFPDIAGRRNQRAARVLFAERCLQRTPRHPSNRWWAGCGLRPCRQGVSLGAIAACWRTRRLDCSLTSAWAGRPGGPSDRNGVGDFGWKPSGIPNGQPQPLEATGIGFSFRCVRAWHGRSPTGLTKPPWGLGGPGPRIRVFTLWAFGCRVRPGVSAIGSRSDASRGRSSSCHRAGPGGSPPVGSRGQAARPGRTTLGAGAPTSAHGGSACACWIRASRLCNRLAHRSGWPRRGRQVSAGPCGAAALLLSALDVHAAAAFPHWHRFSARKPVGSIRDAPLLPCQMRVFFLFRRKAANCRVTGGAYASIRRHGARCVSVGRRRSGSCAAVRCCVRFGSVSAWEWHLWCPVRGCFSSCSLARLARRLAALYTPTGYAPSGFRPQHSAQAQAPPAAAVSVELVSPVRCLQAELPVAAAEIDLTPAPQPSTPGGPCCCWPPNQAATYPRVDARPLAGFRASAPIACNLGGEPGTGPAPGRTAPVVSRCGAQTDPLSEWPC